MKYLCNGKIINPYPRIIRWAFIDSSGAGDVSGAGSHVQYILI
jgi:hypothetical protein